MIELLTQRQWGALGGEKDTCDCCGKAGVIPGTVLCQPCTKGMREMSEREAEGRDLLAADKAARKAARKVRGKL